MTNPVRWLLRFWLLFSFCWLAVIGHAKQDEICAALVWPTPKERADRAARLERNLAIPGLGSEAKVLLIADSEKHNEPKPVRSCIPSALTDEGARQNGGYTTDWSTRAPAVLVWLLPPVVVLIMSLALLWIAGGLRRDP